MQKLFSQQVSAILKKSIRQSEKVVKTQKSGKGLGDSVLIDYIAVIGMVAVAVLAYFANKMLKDQKDSLIL